MTNDKGNGPPAVPVLDVTNPSELNGLSLRDWFAGQALAGLCANAELGLSDYKTLAGYAYGQADAMLDKREIRET